MNEITMKLVADKLIMQALEEDITSEDISTNAVMPKEQMGEVDLICKEDGVIAGLWVFERVFTLLDPNVTVSLFVKDGDEVKKGQKMGTMRIFEKYAVRVGGGYNHRYNLSDGVLLKDNHIGAAGSVRKAVEMAREYAPFVRKIEIETENLDMVREAVEAGADIIMLDNMSPEMMRDAVAYIDGRAKTECSGNVTKENVAQLAAVGVDYISSGALTHSAPILDISLKNLHPAA